jgi:hypothetical protein
VLRNIFYCEQCQESLEVAHAVDIPPHWVELLDSNHPDRALHFCSWHCVRTYSDGRHAPTFTLAKDHPYR